MDKISVHDNFIVSYQVFCEGRQIRMVTEYRDREPFARTLVIFTGVEAYDFYRDSVSNIIFDIREVSVENILDENLESFREASRFGWPTFWKNSLEEVQKYLEEEGTRGFKLSSSYGMTGWVIAREMKIIRDGAETR
jgi:hypothetical protein